MDSGPGTEPIDEPVDEHVEGPAAGMAEGGSPSRLAEPGQRLVARIIDMLIVGLPVVMVTQAVFPRRMLESVAAVLLAAVLVLYESVQLALWGRTPGKWAVGIAVVPLPGSSAWSGSAVEAHDPDGYGYRAADGYGGTEEPAGPEPVSGREMPCPPPGAAQSLLRALTYALPIAVRPVPILGVMAGFFWLANAGLIFAGPDRLALHDRLARTKVIMVR
jgi:uncharacterized RDD family membrane protein YckC